jgi:hypothetical protein
VINLTRAITAVGHPHLASERLNIDSGRPRDGSQNALTIYMMTVQTLFTLFLLSFEISCFTLDAQTFEVGIKTGIPGPNPFKPTLDSGLSLPHSNFTVGPQFEVRLPGGLGLEIDALHTGIAIGQASAPTSVDDSSASNWEFPIILKAHLMSKRGHRSFVGAGPSFRGIWGIRDAVVGKKRAVGSTGFTITYGSEFRVGPISLRPEARYTYWGSITVGGGLDLLLGGRSNQAQVLFGVVF